MLQPSSYKVQFRKAGAVLRRWQRQIYSTTELRVYSTHLSERDEPTLENLAICKDSWINLEAFDAHHSWVTREIFLADAKARLANGEHVYSLVEHGRLVHYGWTAAPIARRYIPEVGQEVEFPANSAYLYDFFTHPECRNRGIYQNSLRHILRELGTTSTIEEAYIGVDSGNIPSRRAIEKIGFSHRLSFFQKWRWNRIHRWSDKKPLRANPNSGSSVIKSGKHSCIVKPRTT